MPLFWPSGRISCLQAALDGPVSCSHTTPSIVRKGGGGHTCRVSSFQQPLCWPHYRPLGQDEFHVCSSDRFCLPTSQVLRLKNTDSEKFDTKPSSFQDDEASALPQAVAAIFLLHYQFSHLRKVTDSPRTSHLSEVFPVPVGEADAY